MEQAAYELCELDAGNYCGKAAQVEIKDLSFERQFRPEPDVTMM